MPHKVKSWDVDPYSARVFILQLEEKYKLTIRIIDAEHHCMIHISKEEKKEDE